VFEVVFVCTGNRARSPLAEALFRRHAAGIDVDVGSAGTLDLGAVPPLPHAIEVARRLGLELSGHRARSLSEVDLSATDLVLGFEPAHVSAAVAVGRAAPDRTFLLRELLALMGDTAAKGDAVAHARRVVAGAASRRVPTQWSAGLTIADPLGKPVWVMRDTALEIDRLVHRLAEGLFGLAAEPRERRFDSTP
jgi:protein-tyrosine phosphatase